jgi:hypothetical protein
VPPAVASTIERLLAKNPAERPQSAKEALASLDDVMTPGRTPTTPMAGVAAAAQIPAPLVITARQSRVMLGVIVVALVIAFVIVATWWARR